MKNNSALSAMGRRSEAPPISWLMEIALARPKLVSLAAGFTDNPSLPVNDVRELAHDLFSSPQAGQAALQYGTTAGDPELREITARHVQTLDTGKFSSKLLPQYSGGRVLITNGSQQLLYMVTEALCDAGDVILVEDPTYFVYLGIAQSRVLDCRGIRISDDGLELEHLESVLESLRCSGKIRRLKMLYVVSYFQNPSSVTTSYAKKIGALKLLRRYERFAGHPIYLLEDAAYRELRFTGEDVPSALAERRFEDRVIYAGTYSKPFSTGLRVGFGLLPQPIFTVVTRLKGNHDFGSANLLQQLIKRAMKSGSYARHLGQLKHRYSAKANVMMNAMRQHLPENVIWIEPRGGLYIWAKMPRRIRTGPNSKFFASALKQNLLYVPGSLCYCDDPSRRKPDDAMRLSFGGATEDNIRIGIERLGKVIRNSLRS